MLNSSCEWDLKAAAPGESSEGAGIQYWGQGWMFLGFDQPNTYFQLPLLTGYILKHCLVFYTLWSTVSLKLGNFL